MKSNESDPTVEFPMPVVSEQTDDMLKRFGELLGDDYRQFKRQFITWLLTEGKDTYRSEGYSEATTKTTHYKVDEAYRWFWERREEYSKNLTPDDATELIDHLARKTPHPDGYTYTFEKSLRRLFEFQREEQSATFEEWEHDIPLDTSDDTTDERDRFYPQEMQSIFRTAMQKYSVRSYHNKDMNAEERDRIKANLAQRLEKPKSEIGPEDFKRANSWKIPSLIALTADVGLRPKEVGLVKTSWLDLPNKTLCVPADEAVKSDKSWECAISTKTVNALQQWLKQREAYEKYNQRENLWLTKMGNPYSSGPLNRLLDQLIASTEIDTTGRSLSWYSFRHGVATMWAEEQGIYQAKNQLRHSNIETTMKYTRGSGSRLKGLADSMW
jgi:integrase